MSKSNAFEENVIRKTFLNTEFPWLPLGNVYVALHSSDPGEAGDQTTNEVSYTGYARVAVSRDGAGWTVSGGQASNTATVQFGLCSAGSATASHFSLGTAASGVGQILYSGALNSPLAISANIRPEFAAGALVVTED